MISRFKLAALLLLMGGGNFGNLKAETSAPEHSSSCAIAVRTQLSLKEFGLGPRFLPFQPYAHSLAEHSPVTLRQVANLLTEVESALQSQGTLGIYNPAVLELTISEYKDQLARLAYKISKTLQLQIDLGLLMQNGSVSPEKKMIDRLLVGSLKEVFRGPLEGGDLEWPEFKKQILLRLGNSISNFERPGILKSLEYDELRVLSASAYRFKSALFELFVGLSVPVDGKSIALNMTPVKMMNLGLIKTHPGYNFEIDALVYNDYETTLIETKSYSSTLEIHSNEFQNLIIQIGTYKKVSTLFPAPKIKIVLLNGMTRESYVEMMRQYPDIEIVGPVLSESHRKPKTVSQWR